MNPQILTDSLEEQADSPANPRRHPLTMENSPEETIKRMRSLPERADKLRQSLSKEKERRTHSRTVLIVSATILLNILMIDGRGQSPSAIQDKHDATIEKEERSVVTKITPVGYNRKAGDYLEKQQFKVGETIRIALFMTNITSETIVTATTSTLFYNRPQLLKDGQSVEYRKEIIPMLKEYDLEGWIGPSVVTRCITIALVPHEPTGVDYIDLSYWYGALELGHYQLTFGRRFRNGVPQVQTNTVTFDVAPAT
jgi:hypothetical protein